MYRRKRFSILVLTGVVVLFSACGRSASSTATSDSVDYAESITADYADEKNADTDENAVQGDSRSDDGDAGEKEILAFDLYGHYDINPELLESTSEHQAIQIGDNVLWLGEATVKDFIDAGALTSEDLSWQEEVLEEAVEGMDYIGVEFYLGDCVKATFWAMKIEDGTLYKDVVIDELQHIEFEGMRTAENIPTLPDLYSIYYTGGIRFTGAIDDINGLGEPTHDETEYNDNFEMNVRVADYGTKTDEAAYNIEVREFDGRIIVVTASVFKDHPAYMIQD